MNSGERRGFGALLRLFGPPGGGGGENLNNLIVKSSNAPMDVEVLN